MKIYVFTLLFSIPLALCAQKNVIKGRAFGLPGARIYTLGLGLERLINPDMSVQVLYNRMVSDPRDNDGGATFIHSVVPEFRWYFGKKKASSMNRAAFWGVFNEINFIERIGSGAPEDGVNHWSGKTLSVNPGVLIGRNVRIANRWYLELYVGGKCRFISRERTSLVNNTLETRTIHSVEPGARAGVNVGFRF